jgi:hypothetical protein
MKKVNRFASRKLLRVAATVALVTAGVFATYWKTAAQASINFEIVNSSTWPAGPDFASDVLGDPWDFCNVDDVAPDPLEVVGWTSFQTHSSCSDGAIGEAGGNIASVSPEVAQFSLLFRGRYGFLIPTRNGRTTPIDSTRYKKLSYRMNDPSPNSSHPPEGGLVNFFFYPWEQPGVSGTQQLGGSHFLPQNVAGYAIYTEELSPVENGMDWEDGPVRGLRLSPRLKQPGATVMYDWVRLTYADGQSGAAMQRVSWSGGTGTATVTVTDSRGTSWTVGTTSNRLLTFNYGILPPGNYTMYARTGTTNPVTVAQRTFTINTPPIVHLTNPDAEGGEDYATTHMNISNGWDMNGPSDVSFYEGLTGPPTFSGGELHATNSACVSNCGVVPTSDPQIWLLGENSNTVPVVPIDTQRYRHFSVRYKTDDPGNTREFGIGRLFWTNSQFLDGNNATHTRDIDTWPGYHTYTIDLATLTATPDGDGGLEPTTSPAPQPWTSANMTFLRFDPLEFPDSRQFHIDYVTLKADDETANGGFTFTWSNVGSDSATVALYLDTDKDPNNGMTQIASGLSAGAHSYFWPQGNTATGRYWVYIASNDGLNTHGRYSTGVLSVAGPTANPAMAIDTPFEGVTVNTTFPSSGWAVDRGSQSGPGVDTLHVWAFPHGSTTGQFVGVPTYGQSRPDIGNALGSQFTNSGYSMTASLSPGTYLLLVYMHSTVTGTFNRVVGHNITVQAPATDPFTRIDTPQFEDTRSRSSNFTISGWALDRGATSGTGVDVIHIWAFKDGQEPGTFVCVANYGQNRPDIGNAFGDSRFNPSGYSCNVNPSQLGFQVGERWFFVVFGHSTVTGSFSQSAGAWVTFTP